MSSSFMHAVVAAGALLALAACNDDPPRSDVATCPNIDAATSHRLRHQLPAAETEAPDLRSALEASVLVLVRDGRMVRYEPGDCSTGQSVWSQYTAGVAGRSKPEFKAFRRVHPFEVEVQLPAAGRGPRLAELTVRVRMTRAWLERTHGPRGLEVGNTLRETLDRHHEAIVQHVASAAVDLQPLHNGVSARPAMQLEDALAQAVTTALAGTAEIDAVHLRRLAEGRQVIWNAAPPGASGTSLETDLASLMRRALRQHAGLPRGPACPDPAFDWTALATRLQLAPDELQAALPRDLLSFTYPAGQRLVRHVATGACGLALNLHRHAGVQAVPQQTLEVSEVQLHWPAGLPPAQRLGVHIRLAGHVQVTGHTLAHLEADRFPFERSVVHIGPQRPPHAMQDPSMQGLRLGGGAIVGLMRSHAFSLAATQVLQALAQAAPDSPQGFDFHAARACLTQAADCRHHAGMLEQQLEPGVASAVATHGFTLAGLAIHAWAVDGIALPTRDGLAGG